MKEFNKKEAKFYGNMFAKLSKADSNDNNVSIVKSFASSMFDAFLSFVSI